MKLSISLREEEVGFLDEYARSQGIKSRSGVVKLALRVLRSMELADDYAAAWAERDDDDNIRAWDLSSGDGLNSG
ncbi:MAG: hypothetical protein OXD35_10070 [Thiotrichales bacterium]|nr:hypothetical protein [Thiotrichales bacterium]